MQKEVAEDIRTIFNASDRPIAESCLSKAVQKYSKSASELAGGLWLEAYTERVGYVLIAGSAPQNDSHDEQP